MLLVPDFVSYKPVAHTQLLWLLLLLLLLKGECWKRKWPMKISPHDCTCLCCFWQRRKSTPHSCFMHTYLHGLFFILALSFFIWGLLHKLDDLFWSWAMLGLGKEEARRYARWGWRMKPQQKFCSFWLSLSFLCVSLPWWQCFSLWQQS